jgi:hypothetical protein
MISATHASPRGLGRAHPLVLALTLAGASWLGAVPAAARDFRPSQLPNGNVFGCATCHVSPAGGGPRNPFGQAVESITGPAFVPFWSAALAALDSDGDGFSNGFELGDPEGDGTAIPGWTVTNPGNAASKPANASPTVTLTAPEDGTSVTAPAVLAVSATATDPDGTIAEVEFFDQGTRIGAVAVPPYSLLVDWRVGTHTLTARATDNLGASATSTPVTLTVLAPEPVTLAPPNLVDGLLTVTWTGGGGPFIVEQKADLAQPWGGSSLVVTERSVALPLTGGAAFVRVADAAVIGPLELTANLLGANERPDPVNSPGTGTGTFTLEDNTLTLVITYTGLTATANAAHIHGPANAEESAPPLIDLAPFNGGAFGTAGTFTGQVILTAPQKAALLGGRTYVNIHTGNFGAGEIRGQILP